MTIDELCPPDIQAEMRWLGKVPGWIIDDPDDESVRVSNRALASVEGWEGRKDLILKINRWISTNATTTLLYVEACSRLMADGPKVFLPTEEQWESMEQVDARLPVSQVQLPFPTMVVQIPPQARAALRRRFGVEAPMPTQILVRKFSNLIFSLCRFGQHYEMYQLIRDRGDGQTLHDALRVQSSIMDNPDCIPISTEQDKAERDAAVVIASTAFNLCVMLTHYGHRVVDDRPKAFNRAEKRARELQPVRVETTHHVVVRATGSAHSGEPGHGEVSTHWRRGHWRTRPGDRLSREKPLVFVRPCLVRADRGEAPQETVYSAK